MDAESLSFSASLPFGPGLDRLWMDTVEAMDGETWFDSRGLVDVVSGDIGSEWIRAELMLLLGV